ncbi:hypothetical protein CEXT_244641 [Caerostris extrusa]|uniref:CASP-like protein n=1 Tax=Caerostris extrusa TaxID=172846 RepID=A0AAV4NB53_CAEEX|nr:hypothetical protein CEXT_244641 [Caerostris extrusa]
MGRSKLKTGQSNKPSENIVAACLGANTTSGSFSTILDKYKRIAQALITFVLAISVTILFFVHSLKLKNATYTIIVLELTLELDEKAAANHWRLLEIQGTLS